MIGHRPLKTLGGGDHGWLKAKLHFDFAGLGNPAHTSLGPLKVWNDDEIQPQTGFPQHAHRDIEIVTFVRDGAITHEDSLGNRGRTVAGDVQAMSAGTGIRHSEHNAETVVTRLFQIWLDTRTPDSAPRWGTRAFPQADRSGRFATLATGERDDGQALYIDADARVMGATVRAGDRLDHRLDGRPAYLVPTSGTIDINGVRISPRDGASITAEDAIAITAIDDTEIVLVEILTA